MRVVRIVAITLLVVGTAAAVGSCGSSKTAKTSAPAPEDRRASAAEVARGLHHIEIIAADIATNAADTAKAKALSDRIEPVWAKIEGTVKANDQDTYLRFEDNFALLKVAAGRADVARARQGASEVARAVAAYLAKYPG